MHFHHLSPSSSRLPSSSSCKDSGQTGFSLAELLVGMVVTIQVIVGVMLLFDANSRVARVQNSVADMQQAQRVAQHEVVRFVRMAGRGGLPQTAAVTLVNNVTDANRDITDAPDSPRAVVGTDILTVRGVFSSPIYQINAADKSTYCHGPDAPDVCPSMAAGQGRIIVPPRSPSLIAQDTSALADAVPGDPLLLTSPISDSIFCVVEIGSVSIDAGTQVATINFFSGAGRTLQSQYLELCPDGEFPDNLEAIAFVGLLEEFRYYIREDFIGAAAGIQNGQLQPLLSRAQMRANTNQPLGNDPANAAVDIAENILDLQIAFGIDRYDEAGGEPFNAATGRRQLNGVIDEEDDGKPSAQDDWLFNLESETTWTEAWRYEVPCAGDTVNPCPAGVDPEVSPINRRRLKLYQIRVNTLARSPDPERTYQSPAIGFIENREYGELDTGPANEVERVARLFRRHKLTTVVDLRNQN